MKPSLRLFFIVPVLFFAGCPSSKEETTTPAQKVEPQAQKPEATKPEASEAQKIASQGGPDVLARVNGQAITDAEVSDRVKNRLQKLQSQIFDIKRDGLGDMIEEKLLGEAAEKKKMSIDDYLKAEVDSKIQTPTQKELEATYNTLKGNLNNQPLDQVKNQLIQQIQATKKRELYSQLIDRLKKDAKVEIYMERPRITVSTDDDPSQGPASAPITIIEFSDFQCPFCKRARGTVKQIMDTYKGKVHYVFRDFPLSFHKNAPKAAEASNCAGDQGKYWEYNTMLWENQQAIAVDDLKGYAKKLGLDEKKFNECLDSGKKAAEIQKDIKDGSEAGVSGTPAYFINGIFISGAQPFERFKEIIDEELQSGGKKS